MKKLMPLIAVFMMGCATQTVEKSEPSGAKTTYRTRAFFSKSAFTKVAVDKTTKTTSQLFGVGEYNAESQGDQLVNLFETLFNAGVQAGKKAVVP